MYHSFPDQTIPEKDKNLSWVKQHVDLAVQILLKRENAVVPKMNRNYQSYNGVTANINEISYLTEQYGKKNRVKYVSYRIGRPNIDQVHGEWIDRPLNASVYTTNVEAVTDQMRQYELMLGFSHAKPELNTLKTQAGVDVLEGMQVPDKDDESAWSQISFKSKYQDVIQIIINDFIDNENIRNQFAENFKDLEIVSEAHGYVVIEQDGNVFYQSIDPRDAIFIENERDHFLKRSPLRGRRRRMTVNEILKEFSLDEKQKQQVQALQGKMNDLIGGNYGRRVPYSLVGNEFLIEVIDIEWESQRPWRTKIVKDKDTDEILYEKDMEPEYYERHLEAIGNDVSKGDYVVETQYQDDLWEAHLIGHELVIGYGRAKWQMHDVDNPSLLMGSKYCSLLFNTVDGVRLSLSDLMENISKLYDAVMHQIHKDISKAHGSYLTYDLAGVPKNTSVKQIMYDIVNDGFATYNSAASGNMANKDLTIKNILKQEELGVSSSFPSLVMMKQDLEQTLGRLTGITPERKGQIKASSTVTNAQESIVASRTITEPMFYFMEKYVEHVLLKMAELEKMTWAFHPSKKGRVILGNEKIKFLQASEDIMDYMFGLRVGNGKLEQKLREKLSMYITASLNAKEIRFIDGLEAEVAETFTDAIAKVKKGWKEMQQIRDTERQDQLKSNEQITQSQIQATTEDREDQQAFRLQEIQAEAQAKMMEDSMKSKNKALLQHNPFEDMAQPIETQ